MFLRLSFASGRIRIQTAFTRSLKDTLKTKGIPVSSNMRIKNIGTSSCLLTPCTLTSLTRTVLQSEDTGNGVICRFLRKRYGKEFSVITAVTLVRSEVSSLLNLILFESGLRKFWKDLQSNDAFVEFGKNAPSRDKVATLSAKDDRIRALLLIAVVGFTLSIGIGLYEIQHTFYGIMAALGLQIRRFGNEIQRKFSVIYFSRATVIINLRNEWKKPCHGKSPDQNRQTLLTSFSLGRLS